MHNASSYDPKRKRFLWGMVLTWTLAIPLVFAIPNAVKGISEQHATGLGAIAGSLAEAYVTFGLILAFVLPVWAIVLLVRSFDGGHRMRALFRFSMCWSALTLVLASLFAWWSLIYSPHTTVGPR